MKFTATALFFHSLGALTQAAQAQTSNSSYVSNVGGVEVHTVLYSMRLVD